MSYGGRWFGNVFVFRCFMGTSSIKGDGRRRSSRVCSGQGGTSRLGVVQTSGA